MENEIKETRYLNGMEEIDPSNVYFRRDGVPYLLQEDENGQPVMTRIPLTEEEITFEPVD